MALRVTFDNMEHGVLMFDRNLKLAAWNRQVVELLESPEPWLSGERHFPITSASVRARRV